MNTFNDWSVVNIDKYFDINDQNGNQIDNKLLIDLS